MILRRLSLVKVWNTDSPKGVGQLLGYAVGDVGRVSVLTSFFREVAKAIIRAYISERDMELAEAEAVIFKQGNVGSKGTSEQGLRMRLGGRESDLS